MPEDSAVLLIRAEPALSRLAAILTKMGSVAIAYSGGVDSTFLLKVACAVLGEKAQGFLAVSESLDRNELKAARQLAGEQGFPLVEIETHSMRTLYTGRILRRGATTARMSSSEK